MVMLLQMRQLPQTVKHVMVISAVPVAYPEVTLLENFMTSIENKNNWMVKSGASPP
jgi:hypothetical protein